MKRDSQNHRTFDDRDVAWINSLICLKSCSMGIREMRQYVSLCLEGEGSIPERKAILESKRQALEEERSRIDQAIAYIDRKQQFYDKVLSGETEYTSNLK